MLTEDIIHSNRGVKLLSFDSGGLKLSQDQQMTKYSLVVFESLRFVICKIIQVLKHPVFKPTLGCPYRGET